MATSHVAPEKVFAAEAAIAGIRVAVVVLNTVLYAFFLDHQGTTPWLAYSIIGAANAYALGVLALEPYRRYPVLLSSYFTTFMDAAFITLWLAATGGVASPFYLLWLLSVTAVAFRFGLRSAIFAAAVYTLSYGALLLVRGELLPHAVDFALRTGYVFLTGATGGLISREVDVQAREKTEILTVADALRESEERFRRLSDLTSEGIAIHSNGLVTEANAAFARMFGWEPDEIAGRHAAELVDPVSLPALAQRLAHPTDEPFEILARRKDGSSFPIEVRARTMPMEGRDMRVVTVRDVSELKRAEIALREREALAMQNERLREMNGMKSRFINSAAHELGTPLTPIKLQAHLLRVGNLGELNPKQKQAVEVLARNADQLGAMVKDLLDASRVQSREIELRRDLVDATALVRDAIDGMPAATARISCEGAPGLFVQADRARIDQVLHTLLDNALRFTPPGGGVEVRARKEGSRVVIDVTDTGIGIEPRELGKLFEPFVQVHDTDQETKSGVGLGLYIARGVVEAHGGRIWATSEGRGRGTTFHVSLPAAS